MTLIAQISDLHIQTGSDHAYGVVDTNPLVVNAINHINSLEPQPDLVIATILIGVSPTPPRLYQHSRIT